VKNFEVIQNANFLKLLNFLRAGLQYIRTWISA